MEGKGLITGLIDSKSPRLPRISQVLFRSTKHDFESFCPLSSNAMALESTTLFANRAASFVALVGPSGCGKTHLLEAASTALQSEFLDSAQVMDAAAWALNPGRRDAAAPLILDNVQDAMERGRVRLQLRPALERRIRAGRPTLLSFTASRQSRTLRSNLPNFKDWIICGLQEPTDGERELLVRHLASQHGVALSEMLVWLIAHRMQGSASSLVGALKRLRLGQTEWSDPAMTLRACGVLKPFFSDNCSWDLREHIVSCACQFESEALSSRDALAMFTMLRVAFLPEDDIAHFFEVEPAAVYTAAVEFEQRISSPTNCQERDAVLEFLRYTIQALRHPQK
jgi:energy-coupling factor transporter ATP-binding protein EcfA2